MKKVEEASEEVCDSLTVCDEDMEVYEECAYSMDDRSRSRSLASGISVLLLHYTFITA